MQPWLWLKALAIGSGLDSVNNCEKHSVHFYVASNRRTVPISEQNPKPWLCTWSCGIHLCHIACTNQPWYWFPRKKKRGTRLFPFEQHQWLFRNLGFRLRAQLEAQVWKGSLFFFYCLEWQKNMMVAHRQRHIDMSGCFLVVFVSCVPLSAVVRTA